ncbi:Nn.00g117160.m01.CDS01 [Neocucurbitaria sp. VM-36]
MRLFSAPSAVLGLVGLAFLPTCALAKPYPVHIEELRQLHNASQLVEKRACDNGGTPCGWYGTLCCASGQQCYTDANNQAQCGAGGEAQATATQAGGQWQYSTTTWVETVGLITYTSVYSTYVPTTATATCKDSQSPCNSQCCDSGFYCGTQGQCVLIGGGSSGGILPTGTLNPSAPLRPTSSGIVIVTYTGTPTATVPFQTPIPTGANGGLVETGGGGGGLSGGAIAGIVIGVILGILLLLLLCLFCCARALFDTIAAIFGFGKKRKHTHEETYIEEQHHSGGGGAVGGGRWYGQGRPSRPSRPASEKKSGMGKGLGMAAALGGLALALGLKRKHDKKDDKSTTVSGSSYYYSDYTSSSSASSSDRHTRRTHHSSRR